MKNNFKILIKSYVIIAMAFCTLVVWTQYFVDSSPFLLSHTLRIVMAIFALGIAVLIPDKLSPHNFAIPLIQVVGVVGISILLFVLMNV